MDYYGTPAGYIEYAQARGWEVAVSPTESIEQWLLNASMYIDGKYRTLFPGKKLNGRAQDREWPRTDAYDSDDELIPETEIPREIEYATYEAAWRVENDIELTPDYVASDRVTSERVGSLGVTYATPGSLQASDTYPVIASLDAILAPILKSNSTASSRLFGEATRI